MPKWRKCRPVWKRRRVGWRRWTRRTRTGRCKVPAVSKAQQHLMAAAAHGADFPMARKVRSTMTMSQLHDFSVGSMKSKPAHVKGYKAKHPAANLGAYHHA